MKKALSLLGLLCFCLYAAYGQSLPAITSATYSTAAPVGDSPKSATTVKVSVPNTAGVKKVNVTVTDGSNAVVHSQQYSAGMVAARSKEGGYILSLKFYTATSLIGATVKIELEDENESRGPAFTAIPN